MPELPEVENVRLSLEKQGLVGQRFTRAEVLRADLRVPFPKRMSSLLNGQTVRAIRRRAKYLLFETDDFILLSHLGMTGSWRPFDRKTKHDHLILHFESGQKLVFNDPRRFGLVDLSPKKKIGESRWLKHLGVEPLSPEFTTEYLFAKTRKLKVPIKGFLMDQRRVVGVGNIYASEALYAAKVKPSRPAGRLRRKEADHLIQHVQRILKAAIAAGGSTIRDYRNSEGVSGSFQHGFLVYDRAGEPCGVCKSKLLSKIIAGRNTFWCGRCQS